MTETAAVHSVPVLADDAEAVAVATALAARFTPGAVRRDRDRAVPREELEAVAASGLLAITVPRELGGTGVSFATLTEVLRVLAVADPSIAQTLLPHFALAGGVAALGSEPARTEVIDAVLAGGRIGNAISERGTKHAWDPRTRLGRRGDGYVLDGTKYYATGALTAQWIAVAAKDEEDRVVLALVRRDALGLDVTADWTSFGQRSTISGSAVLDGVRVRADQILPLYRAYEGPAVGGAIDQILHAAIDVGIARAALVDTAQFVRARTRVWFESEAERAADEPEVVQRVGQLGTRLYVAESAVARAAAEIDAVLASGELTDDNTAQLSIDVAAAKAFAGEVAVELSSALFELAGTSATDAVYGLDRHWRNARTHTVHDPVRWKYRHIGNYLLNERRPPRHPLI